MFLDLHKANGTLSGSVNGTRKGKHCRLRPLYRCMLKIPGLGEIFFGVSLTINVTMEIYCEKMLISKVTKLNLPLVSKYIGIF
jgi:hypothetical protein